LYKSINLQDAIEVNKNITFHCSRQPGRSDRAKLRVHFALAAAKFGVRLPKIYRCNLDSNPFENSIKEIIEYQLPIFDDILAESQKPLNERPLAAALYFVDYCIVEIKGDTKENFAEKEWFKSIYKLIKHWYHERYGSALKANNDYVALGVVLIHKTPFQLNIPLGIAQEKEGNDKRWFCLPISIQDNENVFDWIENKPNLEKIPEANVAELKETISETATKNREIHVNLMTASLEKSLHKTSSTISAHLDKAVRDILSLDGGRISTSYWEIHLAIEKAIKLIILQNGRDHQNKHDLEKLCRIANNIRGVSLDCTIFSAFPSDNEAIKQRYGEGSSFTIQEAVNNYISAVSVISKITELLKRQVTMNNARFLIAIPPWEK